MVLLDLAETAAAPSGDESPEGVAEWKPQSLVYGSMSAVFFAKFLHMHHMAQTVENTHGRAHHVDAGEGGSSAAKEGDASERGHCTTQQLAAKLASLETSCGEGEEASGSGHHRHKPKEDLHLQLPPKAGKKDADSDSHFAPLLADAFSEDTVDPLAPPASELLCATTEFSNDDAGSCFPEMRPNRHDRPRRGSTRQQEGPRISKARSNEGPRSTRRPGSRNISSITRGTRQRSSSSSPASPPPGGKVPKSESPKRMRYSPARSPGISSEIPGDLRAYSDAGCADGPVTRRENARSEKPRSEW